MSERESLKRIDGVTISHLSIANSVGPKTGPSQAVSSCGLNPQTDHDLVTGHLAVGCLGVHARVLMFMLCCHQFCEDDVEEEDCAK